MSACIYSVTVHCPAMWALPLAHGRGHESSRTDVDATPVVGICELMHNLKRRLYKKSFIVLFVIILHNKLITVDNCEVLYVGIKKIIIN